MASEVFVTAAPNSRMERSVPSRDRKEAVFCAHFRTARVSKRTSAKSYDVRF